MVTADLIILDVKFSTIYLNLCCVYRLHQFSEKQFVEKLSPVVPYLSNNIIYVGVGDINILDKNVHSDSYQALLSNSGFISLVNTAARGGRSALVYICKR